MASMRRPASILATLFVLSLTVLSSTHASTVDDAEGVIDFSAFDPESPVVHYRVIEQYPHDPDAFTQGLVYVDDVLYESTGLEGKSTLRRVDIVTGTVLQVRELDDEYFGEGIAVVDDRIYQLTWQERTGFVYDETTFQLLKTFEYQTEGWGLATVGDRLIMSDGSSRLVYRDPATFKVTGHVDVRDDDLLVPNLNELEYIDGEIWANVLGTDFIVCIDPTDGGVIRWIDLTGLLSEEDRREYDVNVLNGIAYDSASERIWVTGKLWPKLFEIELTTST